MNYTLMSINDRLTTMSPAVKQDYLVQIRNLYQRAGWWSDSRDPLEQLVRLITGSHYFVVVIQEMTGMIMGMGRAISDRGSDAYIQDIMVSSEFRCQGIASRIVNHIVSRLDQDGMTWIGLIAENRGTLNFYQRLGFTEMSGAIPMLRKNVIS
jgi:aralkylamine N-acetyltransferase